MLAGMHTGRFWVLMRSWSAQAGQTACKQLRPCILAQLQCKLERDDTAHGDSLRLMVCTKPVWHCIEAANMVQLHCCRSREDMQCRQRKGAQLPCMRGDLSHLHLQKASPGPLSRQHFPEDHAESINVRGLAQLACTIPAVHACHLIALPAARHPDKVFVRGANASQFLLYASRHLGCSDDSVLDAGSAGLLCHLASMSRSSQAWTQGVPVLQGHGRPCKEDMHAEPGSQARAHMHLSHSPPRRSRLGWGTTMPRVHTPPLQYFKRRKTSQMQADLWSGAPGACG